MEEDKLNKYIYNFSEYYLKHPTKDVPSQIEITNTDYNDYELRLNLLKKYIIGTIKTDSFSPLKDQQYDDYLIRLINILNYSITGKNDIKLIQKLLRLFRKEKRVFDNNTCSELNCYTINQHKEIATTDDFIQQVWNILYKKIVIGISSDFSYNLYKEYAMIVGNYMLYIYCTLDLDCNGIQKESKRRSSTMSSTGSTSTGSSTFGNH